jgi:hypothetical protein
MGSFSIWHWVMVLVIVVLVFGMRWPRRAVASSVDVDGLAASWSLPVPRGHHDTYSRAEILRGELGRRLRAAAPAGVALTIYESPRGNDTVWLRLELVKPEVKLPELSLRTVIALTIDRFDFHRFEHVLRLEVGRGVARQRVEGLTELNDADIAALMAYAAGTNASFPRLQSVRVRQAGWQFWRPANKIKRLRRDWPALALLWAGLLVTLLGIVRLAEQFDLSAETCELYERCPEPGLGLLALLAGVALLVARGVMLRRRRTLVLNTGKPAEDPRSLARMDSWQVTLADLGERREAVLKAILQELQQRCPPGVALRSEWIGYASVDSKVEREQQVASFRRAIAFLRLESYGRDLYLGWDSHVNAGVWQEQDIGHGLDRETGRPVVARRVVRGSQALSEYDISDGNFLTEWVHACVVSVVKQQLAEYRIDQEIDFTVQRESRNDALRSAQPGAPQKAARFGAGLFKRTA